MRKIIALLIVISIMLSIVGCSSEPSKEDLEKALTKEIGKVCDTDSLSDEDTLSQRITKISTAVSENKLSSNDVLSNIGSGTATIEASTDFDIGLLGATLTGKLQVIGGIQYGNNHTVYMSITCGIIDDKLDVSELEAYVDLANNVVYSKSNESDHWEKQDLRSETIKGVAGEIPVNTESLKSIDKEAFDKFSDFCDKHTEVTDEGDGKYALKTEFSWKDFYEEYKDNIMKTVTDSVGSLGSYIDINKMIESTEAAFVNKITFTPDNEVCDYEFKIAELGIGDKQEGSIWVILKDLLLNINIDDTDITVEIPNDIVESAEQKQNTIDYMYEKFDKGMSEAQADVEESKANLDKYYSEEDNDADTSIYVAPPTAPETTDDAYVKFEDDTDYELGTDENDDHTFGEFEYPDDYVSINGSSVTMDVDLNDEQVEFKIPNDDINYSESQDYIYSVTAYESDASYFTGADYSMEFGPINSIEAVEEKISYLRDTYGSTAKINVTPVEKNGVTDYVVTYDDQYGGKYAIIYTHVPGCVNCIRTKAFTYERDGKHKYDFDQLVEKFYPDLY